MSILRLPAEEAAVRRYLEELWLPYHRDLEAAVDAHELAEGVDLVSEEIGFRLGRLEEDGYALGVAVDGGPEGDPPTDADIADVDGELVGFVGTAVDEAPSVFDRPDRLIVGDIYVRESYRGTDLAHDMMAWAAERARTADCPELTLEVDVDNERAISFYEKYGFRPYRHEMIADLDDF